MIYRAIIDRNAPGHFILTFSHSHTKTSHQSSVNVFACMLLLINILALFFHSNLFKCDYGVSKLLRDENGRKYIQTIII